MTSYNVIATVDDVVATDDEETGRLLDALAGRSPAISWDSDGRMVVTVTVVARSGLQAATFMALGEISEALRATLGVVDSLVTVEAMTTEEFDRRATAETVRA